MYYSMKECIYLLMVLRYFFNNYGFTHFPTDILKIIFTIIIKLIPPDTMCVHDGGITIRHGGVVYIYCDLSINETMCIDAERVPYVTFMKKVTNHNIKMVKIFKCWGKKTAFIQIKNDLYVIKLCANGVNGHVEKMQKVMFPQNCYNNYVIDIEVKYGKCGAIFNNRLYFLKHHDHKTILTPKIFESLKHVAIISVKIGHASFIALTSEGSVYFVKDGDVHKPIIMPTQEKVVAISCGNNNFYMLTRIGEVYVWNSSNFNQYGVKYNPILLSISDVKILHCYGNTTFVLTNGGDLYACGFNDDGELGLGHTNVVEKLTKVPIQHVENVVCDGKRAFILIKSKIYKSGKLLGLSGIHSNKFEEFMDL